MEETVVKMRCDALGLGVRMPFTQAERLLRIRDNGGWMLDDKGYEFNGERLVRARRKGGVPEAR